MNKYLIVPFIFIAFVMAQARPELTEEDFHSGKVFMEATSNGIKGITDKPGSSNNLVHPQLITSEEIKPLKPPRMSFESRRGFYPDVKIGTTQEFCPSMAIDGSMLYCAVLMPPDGSHPNQWIVIYNSDDYGETWNWWIGIFSSSTAYNLPSLTATADNILVSFVRTAYGSIGAFYRRKDGSSSAFVTIDAGPGCSHPSLNKYQPSATVMYAAYLKNGDVMAVRSPDQGTSWETPQVVASGSYEMKFDGAITWAWDNNVSAIYTVVCYFDASNLYVSRGRSGTWEQVLQLAVETRYPSIMGRRMSSASDVLLIYGDWNNSGQYDLQFTYSYDAGTSGSWQAYYWNEPSYDQLWPIVGSTGSTWANYITVAAWDYSLPSENMVANIRHLRTDVSTADWYWSSANCTPPYLYSDEGKMGLAYRASDGLGYTAFEDRREGSLCTYFNQGDNPEYGIEEHDKGLSNAFRLNQNHPNPAGSRTTIEYSLNESALVELKVYDAIGNTIACLVNERQNPGHFRVIWDITSKIKEQLPNGVYFYQLKSGNFKEAKKLIILR
jgi:hypothetical protein